MVNRLIKILLITAVGVLLIKCGISSAVYLWPKTAITAGPDNIGNSASLELIELTNTYRQGLGLSELIANPRLTQAAVSKAKDILAKQYFNHTSPSGKKFSDWVKEVNYAYFYVGENLAIDFANPQEVFDAWLKSPKHRENIERPEFQEIGLASLKGEFDGRETNVVVQLFGSRVLGADELSTEENNPPLANNYFSQSSTDWLKSAYFGLIDEYLNYLLFFILILLILTLIIRKSYPQKKPAARTATGWKTTDITASSLLSGIKRVSAKKQAPPLISFYTKQTLTANDRSHTSKNTLPPNSRKIRLTKTQPAKPKN